MPVSYTHLDVYKRQGEDGELDDAQNRRILVGSAEVVRILMQFHDAAKESAQPISGEEHDKILTNLIKAMRADLYLSLIHIFLSLSH